MLKSNVVNLQNNILLLKILNVNKYFIVFRISCLIVILFRVFMDICFVLIRSSVSYHFTHIHIQVITCIIYVTKTIHALIN